MADESSKAVLPIPVKILNAEPEGYSPRARGILQSLGELVEQPLRQASLDDGVGEYDVLLVRLGLTISRRALEASKRLRVVVSATTGLDHIDVEAAESLGIAVLSLQGETAFLRSISATAEHAWALLLALLRRIPWAHASAVEGQWNRDAFRGRELRGRRLGIMGLGRVGSQVAEYGQAFGMQVSAFSLPRANWPEAVVRCASMEELLARAEVLSIHLPLNDGTRGLLGAREMAALPAGAVVVNTARGGIVDELALLKALISGHLAGVALDVLSEERRPGGLKSHPLVVYAAQHANLLITPHIGGATLESMARTEEFMANKLKAYLLNTT